MTLEELIDDDNYMPLPQDSGSNFMGRLTKEILAITDAKRSVYVDSVPAFFDMTSFKEVCPLLLLDINYILEFWSEDALAFEEEYRCQWT